MNKVLIDPVIGELECYYANEIDPMWLTRFGLESVPDPIGELWQKKLDLELFGQRQEFMLIITSADWPDVLRGERMEGEFTDIQRQAYKDVLEQWDNIQPQIAMAMLKEYHLCLTLIDYGHDDYKPVQNVQELLPTLYRFEVIIPWQETAPAHYTVCCRCTWEEGHGFGARFECDKLVESGESDI